MKIDKIINDTIFWLNPISTFKEFNQLDRNKKLQAIAATAFATIALTYAGGVYGLGGYFVFRLSVTHLKERPPARKLGGSDILLLPQEIILKIMDNCDETSLARFETSCKFLNTIENNSSWEKIAKKFLEDELAAIFMTDRLNWKQVVIDLKKPVEVKTSELSNEFHFDIQVKHLNLDESLRAKWLQVHSSVTQEDPEALKINLEMLGEEINKVINAPLLERHLNGLHQVMLQMQRTFLASAAATGRIENMQILINHGAKPGTILQPEYMIMTFSALAFYLNLVSPLFAAAYNKQTKALEFLLEKGAKIGSSYFFRVLIDQYELLSPLNDSNKECLNCMLLLLKAAKAQSQGSFHEILDACTNEALQRGFINHLNLLLALGAEFKPQIFLPNIDNFNLPIIKFCHQHQIINLVEWRCPTFKDTLLHYCIVYDKPDVLDFLLSIGVPEDVLNVNGESYKESGSRILKERILNEIALNIKYYKKSTPVSEFDPFPKQALEDCLKYNFDLNELRDDVGNTILHFAVEVILIDTNSVIKQLLAYGANPFLENNAHQTPLGRAKQILEMDASNASEAQLAYAHAMIQTMQNKTQYGRSIL